MIQYVIVFTYLSSSISLVSTENLICENIEFFFFFLILYFTNGIFWLVQKLFDTPGVHLHHRQAAVVHSEDLPVLAPQSRLRGHSFPVCFLCISLNTAQSFIPH